MKQHRNPIRCRLFGHRLPRRGRPFFITGRYLCERCGERVPVR
jgi:hypothetical protein